MKTIRILTITLLLIVALNAIITGVLFMVDPLGSLLGLSVELLQYSPYDNFLMPGIALFILNGLLNINAAIYAIYQWRGWKLVTLFQGVVLFGWIVMQIMMLKQLNFLHLTFAGIGILLMLLGTTPTKKTANK